MTGDANDRRVRLAAARHLGRHLLAGQRRDLDRPAERRAGERDRPLADQVVPVALEDLVLADADDQLQVAARRARCARVAVARVP